MEWYILALILFSSLLVLLLIGVPIAFSIGLISVGALVMVMGPFEAAATLAAISESVTSSIELITLPLFIFMAELLFYAGLGRDIFDAVYSWFGRLPGGLGVATVGSCALFGTLSGSSTAGSAVMGLIALPEMLKRNYDKKLAAGCVACAGGLAHLIPPSILMIVYCGLAKQSVARVFIAGMLPGILLASLFALLILGRGLLNSSLASAGTSTSWRQKGRSLWRLLPALIVVGLVLGTLYAGLTTPTESAAIGAAAVLMMGVILRRMKFKNITEGAMRAVVTSCFVMFIVAMAHVFSLLLSYLNIPTQLMGWVTGLNVSPILLLIVLQIIYVFLGMFVDGVSMMVITLPVVLPIISALGFDLMWFGILLMINVEMAIVTPPVGINLYVIKGIAPPEISLGDIIKGILPFIGADIACLAIVMAFPQVALWLPSTMG